MLRSGLPWFPRFTMGVVLATLGAGPAAAAAADPPPPLLDAARAGRVRVLAMLDVAAPAPDFLASPSGRLAIEAAGDRVLARLPLGQFELKRRFVTVNALAVEVSESGLRALAADPEVTRVDLDAPGEGHLNQAVPLARVDVVRALGFTGEGIRVAVIDSGVNRTHPDLSDDLVAEQCFCSGGTGCCPGGGTTQSGPGSAQDDNGHGTNVAGILTSRGTQAPLGGAPDTELVAVKVLNAANGFCCTSDVIAGMDWVGVNQPTVRVVNLSLGTFTLFAGNCDAAQPGLATAVDNLRAAGMLVTVSSGNQGSGTQMSAPACNQNATSVGAVWDANVGPITILGCTETATAADQVTCFSNSNSTTDIFAPGAPTTSTGLAGPTSTFFGTSQAAPLVAACAADLFQVRPSTTPAEMETALESSLVMVTDPTNGLSFPRLDCERALVTVPVELQSFTIE
jgi:subtilisin family serine protease